MMKNGVQEGHGLMRQIFRVFVALYLRNALPQHVKIDMVPSGLK